jgi:hypothetical protein
MHFPPETASIMILARMIATVQQADDPASALHLFMQVRTEYYFIMIQEDRKDDVAHITEQMIAWEIIALSFSLLPLVRNTIP